MHVVFSFRANINFTTWIRICFYNFFGTIFFKASDRICITVNKTYRYWKSWRSKFLWTTNRIFTYQTEIEHLHYCCVCEALTHHDLVHVVSDGLSFVIWWNIFLLGNLFFYSRFDKRFWDLLSKFWGWLFIFPRAVHHVVLKSWRLFFITKLITLLFMFFVASFLVWYGIIAGCKLFCSWNSDSNRWAHQQLFHVLVIICHVMSRCESAKGVSNHIKVSYVSYCNSPFFKIINKVLNCLIFIQISIKIWRSAACTHSRKVKHINVKLFL